MFERSRILSLVGFLMFVAAGYFYASAHLKDAINAQRSLGFKEAAFKDQFQQFDKKDKPYIIGDFTVSHVDGRSVSSAGLSGQYVVLNVWATWCSPCLKELPSLKALSKQLNNKWSVIAISIDTPNRADMVKSFVQKYDVIGVAGYHDNRMTMQNILSVSKLPTTFILDDRGHVLYEIQGDAEWDNQVIVDFLNHLSGS